MTFADCDGLIDDPRHAKGNRMTAIRMMGLTGIVILSLGVTPDRADAYRIETASPTVTIENGVVVVRGSYSVKRLAPVERLPRSSIKVTNRLGPTEALPRTRLPGEKLAKTATPRSKLKGSALSKTSLKGSNLFRSRFRTVIWPSYRKRFSSHATSQY